MITRWLKRILKYTLLFILFVIIGIVSWLSYYYVTEVRPYKPIFEDILANSDPENRNPPANIVAMIDANFYCEPENQKLPISDMNYCNSKFKKNSILAKLLPPIAKPHPKSHFFHLMMAFTLIDNLSEQDKNALYSELSQASYDKRGLNYFSKEYFCKPLSKLSVQESAKIITVLGAPSLYLRKPERWRKSTQYLLDKYNKMQK